MTLASSKVRGGSPGCAAIRGPGGQDWGEQTALPRSWPDLQEENRLAAGQEIGHQGPLRGDRKSRGGVCAFLRPQEVVPLSTVEAEGCQGAHLSSSWGLWSWELPIHPENEHPGACVSL